MIAGCTECQHEHPSALPASLHTAADLHALDLATWTWYVPRQEGTNTPAQREQASAAFADGRLLVFGGRTNGARLNDLWCWSGETGLWEQMPVHGTAPSPRQGAAACVADGQLYIMGGSSNFVLQVGNEWARVNSLLWGCSWGEHG